jgi:AcrR family transcriptional regulator
MARPRLITDEQILAATREIVLDHGVQSPLELVSQRLGVTAPALLKRFGTRQALLVAALSPDDALLDAVFDVPVDDRPLTEQLEGLIARLSRFFAHMFPRLMALRECGVPMTVLDGESKVPRPVRAVRATQRWLEQARAGGLVESALVETAATAIVGALSTRAISSHLSKRPWSSRSEREYQQELALLFTRALGGVPAQASAAKPRARAAKPRAPASPRASTSTSPASTRRSRGQPALPTKAAAPSRPGRPSARPQPPTPSTSTPKPRARKSAR